MGSSSVVERLPGSRTAFEAVTASRSYFSSQDGNWGFVLANPRSLCPSGRPSTNVQPEVPPWNRLGYGNNAIEVVHVEVR